MITAQMLSDRPIEVRFKGGATDKRLIFDKADAVLNEAGWQTAISKSGQTPQEYPCVGLDIDEMGAFLQKMMIIQNNI